MLNFAFSIKQQVQPCGGTSRGVDEYQVLPYSNAHDLLMFPEVT